MKKYIATAVAGVALVISTGARAESWFSFEAGIGASSAVKAGDNIWYHEGNSHQTPINSVAGRVGIRANIFEAQPRSFVPGLRAHLTYNYFGGWSWSAQAGEDPNVQRTMGYNVATKSCFDNNCGSFRRFDSSGNIQGLALTIEPYWDLGSGWTVGIEAGPALFRSTWNVTATCDTNSAFGAAGSQEQWHRDPRIQLGWLLGASIGKGPISLRYNYLKAPVDYSNSGTSTRVGGGQWVPSGVKGIHMLTLNYTF